MCVVPTLGHSGSQGTEAAWASACLHFEGSPACFLSAEEHWGLCPALLSGSWSCLLSSSQAELLPHPTLTTLKRPSCVLAPPASWADASQAQVKFLNRLPWQPFLPSLFLIESRFRFTAEKSEGSRDFSHIKTSHTASSTISSTPKGKCLRVDGPARHAVTTNLH